MNSASPQQNKRNIIWTEQDELIFRNVLQEGLEKLKFPLPSPTIDLFTFYAKEMVMTNNNLNLTAITDPKEVAEKHFLDSFLPMLLLPMIESKEKNLQVADIGTGAGFPGLPLAILYRNWQVTLIDSLQKRCRFLQDLSTKMSCTNVLVQHGRVEELGKQTDYREKQDLVMARAVARLPVLVEYCLPFVAINGLFVALKGADGQEELQEAQKAIEELGGKLAWAEESSLPFSGDKRFLIGIKKIKSTPSKYPRRAGIPAKNPIL
ncbi:16S rRNA (guanine(527)-N(7))-methyltransferase RsmG [Heliorestis acidaminivorans]|uniref:Ribosomal RNA small subunit methyltransferase G n=1 Tax=Heliorestis acidaminivorans TaxID=553427 RepID=A0A6I0F2Y6_9FIRM|nr:16S rRNA (guanine(527)-N(7))-methyltransferase RsmG [Heliorestis acidaminivorans]KAB2953920.1 16S rRNA (guanine(527)-N(7))-methyltransferase RsmG [Heliorestis acidaminivorans]